VRLVGRHHVPIKEIRAVLKTRAPSLLPWREKPIMRRDFLQADTLTIEGVYRQHGYLDARAHYRLDPGRSRNTVVVTFRIEEGPRSRIASVELDGVRALPEAALRKKLYARPGRPFNPLYLVADTTRISAAYKEKGHLPHIVASSHREGLRVTVRYAVNEGPVYRYGQVYISSPGELHVRERLIRRELLLKPDDVYRASRVQRSIERLYDSGFFSQVQMTPLVDSTNTRVEFDLRVRERKPRWIDAGVGSGTAERLRFTGEWGHRNLNGRGLQGVLSSKLALDGQARFLLSRGDASLLEPWLLRSRTRGLINGYYEKDHDRADPRWVAKVETRGVSVQLRRELGRFAHIALTQDNAFVNQIYAFEHPVADSTLESLAVFVPRNYTTHRLQLSGDRDTRDDPLNPGHGSAQSATAVKAGSWPPGSGPAPSSPSGGWPRSRQGSIRRWLASRSGTDFVSAGSARCADTTRTRFHPREVSRSSKPMRSCASRWSVLSGWRCTWTREMSGTGRPTSGARTSCPGSATGR